MNAPAPKGRSLPAAQATQDQTRSSSLTFPRLFPYCLSNRAGSWIPTGGAGLLLKVCGRNHGVGEICRVLELRREDEIRVAVRFNDQVIIFRQSGVSAIRHAIPSQVSGFEPGCDDFQRAGLFGGGVSTAP